MAEFFIFFRNRFSQKTSLLQNDWELESFSPHIKTLTSPFLLVGDTKEQLRNWKKNPSHSFEENFYRCDSFQKTLKKLERLRLDALVPIPQKKLRSLTLGGGPALRLSALLSPYLKIPIRDHLQEKRKNSPSQAKQRSFHRYLNPKEFTWTGESLVGRKILLIDDFWTSGQTLRSAARTLHLEGSDEIHGYVLGFKPFQRQEELPQKSS